MVRLVALFVALAVIGCGRGGDQSQLLEALQIRDLERKIYLESVEREEKNREQISKIAKLKLDLPKESTKAIDEASESIKKLYGLIELEQADQKKALERIKKASERLKEIRGE